MKTAAVTIRNVSYLLTLLAISVAFMACGGGGTGSNLSGASTGGTSVGVSLAAATDFPEGTTFAAPSTTAPNITVAPAAPDFEHVWATVTKLALIPAPGQEFPDRNGELETMNTSSEEGNSGMPEFVTFVLPSPVVIDLLDPPTDRKVAKILNKFSEVPPGEYSKIRVYYSTVEGQYPNGSRVLFHQTAHYHFDVHFVGGNLIVPVPVATDPNGGIRFFSISIHVVGLKFHQAGNSGNILLRPQIFATVSLPKYLVSGVAKFVNPADNTFTILTAGGGAVPAVFLDNTTWLYIDNTIPSSSWSSVGDFLGARGLQDNAIVDVIGAFSPGKVLQAEEVDVTFPKIRSGKVYLGWNLSNNTFMLRSLLDNTVIPMPSRTTAYYDNAADPSYPQLPNGDLAIVDNVAVTVRGYAGTLGIEAFWISIGP